MSERRKTCHICGTPFTTKGNGGKHYYCPECAALKETRKYTENEIAQIIWRRHLDERGNQKAIATIEGWARRVGMHYGQYVGRYGARPPELACPRRMRRYEANYEKPVHPWAGKTAKKTENGPR